MSITCWWGCGVVNPHVTNAEQICSPRLRLEICFHVTGHYVGHWMTQVGMGRAPTITVTAYCQTLFSMGGWALAPPPGAMETMLDFRIDYAKSLHRKRKNLRNTQDNREKAMFFFPSTDIFTFKFRGELRNFQNTEHLSWELAWGTRMRVGRCGLHKAFRMCSEPKEPSWNWNSLKKWVSETPMIIYPHDKE